MSTDFATVLDDCLYRLRAGDTISACLERYPDYARELKPLLETVQLADSLRFTEPPRPHALARGRQRFLTEAARLREEQRTSKHSLIDRVRDFFTTGISGPAWVRAATAIVVVLLLFGTASGVVVQASESSLPGDTLYSVKQVTRQVQLITIRNPEARVAKVKQIQAEEREEVRQATEQGRIFEKDVAGIIIDWQANSFVLEDGLTIHVSDETDVLGQPRAGSIADVHVRSEDGRLVAERVAVREQAPTERALAATETATDTPSATIAPTEIATDTPTKTDTPQPTKQPTKKVVPSKTLTPKPTVTDTPFPTATAVVGPVVHVFELRGTIDSIGETVWVVAGQEIHITSDTIIKGQPAVGRTAHVRANRFEDGRFEAIEINVEAESPPPQEKVTITGVVESKERDSLWRIGGYEVRTDDRTKYEGELRLGAFAEVVGVRESSRRVFAHRITILRACENPALFEGVILSIDSEAGLWIVEVIVSIEGQDSPDQFIVSVDDETQIQGAPVVGAVVQIEACQLGDRSFSAQRIFVVPTPTPTSTETPTQTSTPEPPSLQATPTVGPEETVTPSPTTQDTQMPTVEPSPVATDTALPDDTTLTPTP
ncbi:MAG: DUF5666 domain-containing protein [Anaerolineae bacterium]